jgi:hypothetical protein
MPNDKAQMSKGKESRSLQTKVKVEVKVKVEFVLYYQGELKLQGTA